MNIPQSTPRFNTLRSAASAYFRYLDPCAHCIVELDGLFYILTNRQASRASGVAPLMAGRGRIIHLHETAKAAL